MMDFDNFTETDDSIALGTSGGGTYRGPDGNRWYLKWPKSERQAHNEVMASRAYKEMGFDAVQYHLVDNGMVASPWREGLQASSSPTHIVQSRTVQEAYLPSALLGNWDVIGLEWDNVLYDPRTMDEPVFLDFGGAFDTRALGASKDYGPDTIPSLNGFLDASVNRNAARVFTKLDPQGFEASKQRVRDFTVSDMSDVVDAVPISDAGARLAKMESRRDRILGIEYGSVFPP
jgi:hypothetical protein